MLVIFMSARKKIRKDTDDYTTLSVNLTQLTFKENSIHHYRIIQSF